MIIDADDFGVTHKISDQTQSRDCRGELDRLHYANPNFKITLFTIPGEMTMEMIKWCEANKSWVSLALHGFYHTDNWECSSMSYEEFDENVQAFQPWIDKFFVKGFKAPGWQISDDIFKWLKDHDWWVADQSYNDNRRPEGMKAYVNNNGVFTVGDTQYDASHHHTWNCEGNGIEEMFPKLEARVKEAKEFQFIGELFQ